MVGAVQDWLERRSRQELKGLDTTLPIALPFSLSRRGGTTNKQHDSSQLTALFGSDLIGPTVGTRITTESI